MKNNKVITVINQAGEKVDLELLDDIKMDGNEYVIVGPKESDEAYAYKSVVKNGEVEYTCLTQGKEFNKVLEKYNQH